MERLIFILDMTMNHIIKHGVKVHVGKCCHTTEGVQNNTLNIFHQDLLHIIHINFIRTNEALRRLQAASGKDSIEDSHDGNKGVKPDNGHDGIKLSVIDHIQAGGGNQNFGETLHEDLEHQQCDQSG